MSYASQDADAARRICDALRAAGVEVWFDQSELIGGDAWDQKIRSQIKECALFLPIISANTQARAEGYFRLEWRLADQRTHLMGKSKAFLVPICIDDTRDTDADVPDSFLTVQWTRLPGGETPPKFCERVKHLLAGGTDSPRSVPSGIPPGAALESRTAAKQRRPTPMLAAITAAVLVTAALAIWQPWQPQTRQPPTAAATNAPEKSSELRQAQARIQPDRWQRQDFDAISATLDRLIQRNQEDAEAWALRSIINSLQVMRNFDSGTKPLEIGKAAAERALRISPASSLAELAFGMHLVAMFSRGGDVSAARPHLARGLAGLPRDPLTRYAELTAHWLGYQFEDTERSAQRWLGEEPHASFPAWILAQMHVVRRQPDEAEKWAARAAADRDITGVRALVTAFEARYYLRADLVAARAALEKLPADARPPHRLVFSRWLVAMAERNWDQALQELARLPDPILFDRNYHGPKALLVGLAHQAAGNNEVARGQWTEAERLLRAELASDNDNEELRAVLAVTLACAGRAEEARTELAAVEPLIRGRKPSVYSGGMIVLIAQAYGAMGDTAKMLPWLRRLLTESAALPFTPASVRLDPRFAKVVNRPEVQALLTEFASLDQPSPANTPAEPRSIAVLAFKTIGGDTAGEIFAEGISEELLNVLAKVPGLRVAARASAFYFKDKKTTSQEVGQKLGVAYLVEGTVQRAEGTVRVNAEMVRADTGEQVWRERFDGELKNILVLQDEIAGKIADRLKLKLGASRSSKTVNPEVHQLVLEGRHYTRLRSELVYARAQRAFTNAITIDPTYAAARSGLAELCLSTATYAIQDGASYADMRVEIERARSEATAAIELDPDLSDAHAVLGYVLMLEGRLSDAERQFEKSAGLNANEAIVYAWRTVLRLSQGRLEDALLDENRTAQLDPLWPIALAVRGEILRFAGRYDEALQTADRLTALRPDDFVPNIGNRIRLLHALGRPDEAVAAARLLLAQPGRKPRRDADAAAIWVLSQAGRREEAEAAARQVLNSLPAGSHQRGFVLGALGRFEEALPFLARTPVVPRRWLYWDAMWDRWRDDPRFTQLIEALGCATEYKMARATVARMK